MDALKGKKILLGITSGVAIYKSLELCRLFVKSGADVRIVMTENAVKLISPQLFETLSKNKVYYEMWKTLDKPEVEHISNAGWADLMLVCPATANIIGKIANGIADDVLSTVFLAYKGDVFIAPAMNDAMYDNRAVQDNLKILVGRGIKIISPEEGELACGTCGVGRLADIEVIFEIIKKYFRNEKTKLSGKRILISAGPTREYIDPVRFISNPSSGKMGYALANEFAQRGADVKVISGPVSIAEPENVEIEKVSSAAEMCDAMKKSAPSKDIIIFCAAVGDYKPQQVSDKKIKKDADTLELSLVKNPDIAMELLKVNKTGLRIGFAAESDDLINNAKEKLKKKKFDLIIANNISNPKYGFESDKNKISIIDKSGKIEEIPPDSKSFLSKIIADRIEDLLK